MLNRRDREIGKQRQRDRDREEDRIREKKIKIQQRVFTLKAKDKNCLSRGGKR